MSLEHQKKINAAIEYLPIREEDHQFLRNKISKFIQECEKCKIELDQIKDDLLVSTENHQSLLMRAAYSIKMYEKYTKEIKRKISLSAQSHRQTVKELSIDLNQYQHVIEQARERKINTRIQQDKWEQIKSDLPSNNESHQFFQIKVNYCIKMLRTYYKEIGRKVAQHDLYYKNQEKIFSELEWQLRNMAVSFSKWMKIAEDKNIDISSSLTKLNQIVIDQITNESEHQINSVKLLYVIRMYKFYFTQIVCTVAQTEIDRAAHLACQLPQIENNPFLIDFVKASKKKLSQYLPLSNDIRSRINNLSIEGVELQYAIMKDKMEEASAKIAEKARI